MNVTINLDNLSGIPDPRCIISESMYERIVLTNIFENFISWLHIGILLSYFGVIMYLTTTDRYHMNVIASISLMFMSIGMVIFHIGIIISLDDLWYSIFLMIDMLMLMYGVYNSIFYMKLWKGEK